jgi:hypothetical protein
MNIIKNSIEAIIEYKIAHAADDNQCTFFPNGDWLPCCVMHDYGCKDAQCQKSASMRLKADIGLFHCVASKGTTWYGRVLHVLIAALMFLGVRLWVYVKNNNGY